MNRFRLAAPMAAVTLLAGLLVATPVEAAPAPSARNDSVSVKANVAKTVNVLANDTLTRKQKKKARVRVVKIKGGNGLTARTNKAKKKVVVKARTAAAGKKFKVKYRVILPKKRKTSAWVVVRVAKKTANNAPTGKAPLVDYIKSLPVKAENRSGYDRALYKHWNAGLNPTDGCDTRREVLLAEAVKKPTVGSKCSFTGGQWVSVYDGQIFTDASKMDIDHMVPLAEAHDSGAHAWDAARREAFANDQGDDRSLVAVSASSNRSKGDRDPAEWLPQRSYVCEYVAAWTAVKVRWSLSVDTSERSALLNEAASCGTYLINVKKF